MFRLGGGTSTATQPSGTSGSGRSPTLSGKGVLGVRLRGVDGEHARNIPTYRPVHGVERFAGLPPCFTRCVVG